MTEASALGESRVTAANHSFFAAWPDSNAKLKKIEAARWDPSLPGDLRFALAVLAEACRNIEDKGLHFYLTKDPYRLPEYGRHVVAVLLLEERCKVPWYARHVRTVIRNTRSVPFLGFRPRLGLNRLERVLTFEYARDWALHWRSVRALPAKLVKIPLGVRLDRFSPTARPPQDSFDVLFAGAVCIRKGIPYLLEAFANLRHPAKKLRLAGAVSPEIRPLLGRFNLNAVEFLGPVPQPELARWMSASHVMVLPSVEDGFGMVMAQAMACGTPVIASEHTGGRDLFTNGVEGFVVPIRSPESICERLTQLADDPGLRERMSEAALARVRSLGGWREYGQNYAAFLKKIPATS